MQELTIRIPAIGPSANDFFGRMHPMKRSKIVRQWHQLVLAVVRQGNVQPFPVEQYPAIVECRVFFPVGSRRCDWDNLYGTVKLTLDGLVHAGVLVNDSPKYLAGGIMIPDRSGTREGYTVITIRRHTP